MNVKKNILLLDTNIASFPIYKYLISKNYNVYVMGQNREDFLARYSCNYIENNYSDLPATKKLLEKYQFNHIVPGCNDVSYLSCSKINADNTFKGVDSFETTEIINSKDRFKSFAHKNNLSVAKSFTQDNIPIGTKVVIKPIDSYSGRGISVLRFRSKSLLSKAIQKALEYSKSKNYIIEEYIDGKLFSHSAFIKKGKIFKDFIVSEHCIFNKETVDTSWILHDHKNLNYINKLYEQIEFIASELSLVDGVLHTQFILKDDDFFMIELTRRCPGDLYSHLIELSTGFPYAAYYTMPFIKVPYRTSYKSTLHQKYIIRHTIANRKNFIFTGLSTNLENPSKASFIPFVKTGDNVMRSPFGRAGLLFLQFNSFNDLIDSSGYFLNNKIENIYSVDGSL